MTEDEPHDLLLRGGTVVDGSGAPRFAADVGVRAGRIAYVGTGKAPAARASVDVGGLIVAPGFIDSHAHDDRAVLSQPELAPKVSQGVTTVINGNCGNSLAPYPVGQVPPLPLREVEPQWQFASFPDYLAALERQPAAVNVGALVGHTSLRVRHVADLSQPALAGEIAAMRAAVREALQAGALGLSSGTFYPPAAAAPAHELVQVGADLKAFGGIYATHLRDEGDAVLDAIDEAAAVAKALGVALLISHHKVMGVRNFGRTADTLRRIALLRELQPICMDCYPYTASSSMLRPERLASSEEIIVTSSRSTPDAAGRTITQLATQWNCTREEALHRVMPGTGVYFMMHEEDVRRVLAEPTTMIGSDGISSDAHPHPRLWGSFARVLGRYSRDLGLFRLEAAVHKMTGLTARALGLHGRGEIRRGFAADLAVFDAATVVDRATYEEPRLACDGMQQVFVNGSCVWRHGRSTGALPGQCLRRR